MPNLRNKTWTPTTPAKTEDANFWENHLYSDEDAAFVSELRTGGGAGHQILNDDGVEMPKQKKLQFKNAEVSNDATGGITIVDTKGAKGDAATVRIGTVTTGAPGTNATVTNSGTTTDAVFNFTIPRGSDGDGAVDKVNNVSPVNGNVTLKAANINVNSGDTVENAIASASDQIATVSGSVDNINSHLNNWTIYPVNAFSPDTMTFAEVCAAMVNRSIFMCGLTGYENFGGNIPTVGVLKIVKIQPSRTYLTITRALAGDSWPDTFLATYSSTNSKISAWTRLATDNGIGQAVSLRNCACLLIGNSYAYGSGGTAGKGWAYYFQQRTGCTAEMIRQSGGDFAAKANDGTAPDYPGKTYLEALQAYTAERTVEQRQAVKYIIVGGGFNDTSNRNSGGVAAVRTAIDNFVTYARSHYPYARIFIIPLYCTVDFPNAKTWDVLNAWTDEAAKNGCATTPYSAHWFHNLSEYQSTTDSSGPIHLNDAGYQLAGAYIAAVVAGWDGKFAGRETGQWRILYNANNCTIKKMNNKVVITMNGATKLPTNSDIDAAGVNWTPYAPATRYIPCWEYNTGVLAFVQLNASSGLTNVRAVDKTSLTSYRLYTTFEYDTND